MKLNEIFDPDDPEDEPEDEEPSYDHLPPSSAVKALKLQIATAAQKIYDEWIQDDNDDLNGGGICHLIADAMAGILGDAGMVVTSQSANDVQHVYCVGQFSDGVFEIDIPYWLYERGGGYTWTKLPDVQFTPNDVIVSRLDSDPGNMKTYVDEWD
jgi:hypothetical protein